MRRWALAATLFLGSPVLCEATRASRPDRLIQIGIRPRAEEVSLLAHGRYTVIDADGTAHDLPRRPLLLAPRKDGLQLEDWRLPPEARLAPQGPEDALEIDGMRYRGTLLLRLDLSGETVTVVEEVGIEDYLLGVLPYEMDPSWPIEALKAQAVVARTFAYTQLGKYRKEGFDLSSDTRSQVYRGRGDNSASIRKAVAQTRGEVLGYQGEIVDVYYHACCGGHTAHAGAIWGGKASPLLRGVKDRYCRASPLRAWTAFFRYDELLAAIQGRRLIGGALSRFEIERRDAAGYVHRFTARIGGETLSIKGNDLRKALGGASMRSTRIDRVRKLGKGVEFRGSGMGHGVGLCQWGARLQAERGRRYETILKFYLPGSTLSVVDE